MAKQPTQAQLEKEAQAEGDANTLIAAKKIEANKEAHSAAINVIQTRQQIATLVLKGA